MRTKREARLGLRLGTFALCAILALPIAIQTSAGEEGAPVQLFPDEGLDTLATINLKAIVVPAEAAEAAPAPVENEGTILQVTEGDTLTWHWRTGGVYVLGAAANGDPLVIDAGKQDGFTEGNYEAMAHGSFLKTFRVGDNQDREITIAAGSGRVMLARGDLLMDTYVPTKSRSVNGTLDPGRCVAYPLDLAAKSGDLQIVAHGVGARWRLYEMNLTGFGGETEDKLDLPIDVDKHSSILIQACAPDSARTEPVKYRVTVILLGREIEDRSQDGERALRSASHGRRERRS